MRDNRDTSSVSDSLLKETAVSLVCGYTLLDDLKGL
jgi:hypothetical protein